MRISKKVFEQIKKIVLIELFQERNKDAEDIEFTEEES